MTRQSTPKDAQLKMHNIESNLFWDVKLLKENLIFLKL